MSLIWPAVCHGSFVISTSPGSSVSGGWASMKWRMPVAIVLMWPGVPVSDWAIMFALRSNTPHARSCDSRTTVEKAVRISVTCCSLTTDSSRFQSTSRRMDVHHATVTTRFHRSSTTALPPGPITSVDSRSSTIAGPSIRPPGASR